MPFTEAQVAESSILRFCRGRRDIKQVTFSRASLETWCDVQNRSRFGYGLHPGQAWACLKSMVHSGQIEAEVREDDASLTGKVRAKPPKPPKPESKQTSWGWES